MSSNPLFDAQARVAEPSAAPQGGTSVIERTVPREVVEPGDHERFAHYVQKDKIVESAVTGTPVIALCGKVWVPGRDPQKFPVCPSCKAIFEGFKPGPDEGGNDADGGS